jgi:glutamate/tyrosine decarboxylase-like PLP-dependent enzyme
MKEMEARRQAVAQKKAEEENKRREELEKKRKAEEERRKKEKADTTLNRSLKAPKLVVSTSSFEYRATHLFMHDYSHLLLRKSSQKSNANHPSLYSVALP